jgi:hypothetical protein
MKKFVLLLMGLLFLSGLASAYQVNINAPDTLPVGKPLIVNGTTTFGIGTPIDIVLYYQLTTTTEIQRKIVYVQSDYTFRTVFDTTGLKTGMYKVEVPTNGNGNSVTMRVVNLIDRSEDLQLSSSLSQNFNGKILIAGMIKGDENSGVQVEVFGPDNIAIFGPQYVNTNYQGSFSIDVPVTDSGDYEVSFTDATGYVGNRIITVTGPQYFTTGPTASLTKSSIVSAHTKASQVNPAYFAIKTGYGQVNIQTSSSVDWIIEYVDDNGTIRSVNNQMDKNPEKIQILGTGKTIYIKVYPYRTDVNSEVFVYAENASSIVLSPAVPLPFASATPPTPTKTPQASIMPVLGVIAVSIILAIRNRK